MLLFTLILLLAIAVYAQDNPTSDTNNEPTLLYTQDDVADDSDVSGETNAQPIDTRRAELLAKAQAGTLTIDDLAGEPCDLSNDHCGPGLRCWNNPNPLSGPQCQPIQKVIEYQLWKSSGTALPETNLGIECPGGFGCLCGGNTGSLCEEPLTCVSKDLQSAGICCSRQDREAGLCPPDPTDSQTPEYAEAFEGEVCGPISRTYCSDGLVCDDGLCRSIIESYERNLRAPPVDASADYEFAVTECEEGSIAVNDPVRVPCANNEPGCEQTLYRAYCKALDELTADEIAQLEAEGYEFRDIDEELSSCLAEIPYDLRTALPLQRGLDATISTAFNKGTSEIRLKDMTFWLTVLDDGTLLLESQEPPGTGGKWTYYEKLDSDSNSDSSSDSSGQTGTNSVSGAAVIGDASALFRAIVENAKPAQPRTNTITGAITGTSGRDDSTSPATVGQVDSTTANNALTAAAVVSNPALEQIRCSEDDVSPCLRAFNAYCDGDVGHYATCGEKQVGSTWEWYCQEQTSDYSRNGRNCEVTADGTFTRGIVPEPRNVDEFLDQIIQQGSLTIKGEVPTALLKNLDDTIGRKATHIIIERYNPPGWIIISPCGYKYATSSGSTQEACANIQFRKGTPKDFNVPQSVKFVSKTALWSAYQKYNTFFLAGVSTDTLRTYCQRYEPIPGSTGGAIQWVTTCPSGSTCSGGLFCEPDQKTITQVIEQQGPAQSASGCQNINGKTYCVVNSEDQSKDSGTEVCQSVGQQCVGYTARGNDVCKAFHPRASQSTSTSGDVSGIYCNGAPQKGVCSLKLDTCHYCPDCTVGLSCDTAIGGLYREAYVECAPADTQVFQASRDIEIQNEYRNGYAIFEIDKTYAELRAEARKRCPNKADIALYMLSQLDEFTIPEIEISVPSMSKIWGQLGGPALTKSIAAQAEIVRETQSALARARGSLAAGKAAQLGIDNIQTMQDTALAFATTTNNVFTEVAESVTGAAIRSPLSLFPPAQTIVNEIGGACGIALRAECVEGLVCAQGTCQEPRSDGQECIFGQCMDGLSCWQNPRTNSEDFCVSESIDDNYQRWESSQSAQCPGGYGCECQLNDRSSCQAPLDCFQVGGTRINPVTTCCHPTDAARGLCDISERPSGSACKADTDCASGSCQRIEENQYTCA